MNKENNNTEYKESNSLILDLESLSAKYKNLLIQYQQAVSNYVDHLKKEANQPCGLYNSNSKNISQTCYNYIWNKSGCGAGTIKPAPSASNDWAKNQTLDGLIKDSWLWATMTDYTHRMGCYGNPGNAYTIIGIGTDGNLFSREGLDSPWKKVNDNSNGQLISLFTGPDNKLYATNKNREIIFKNKWSDSTWTGTISGSCCVISAAMGQDSTIVGVGTDNKLYSRSLNGSWALTATPGEWISSVAIAPDGSIFVVGGGNQIWKKNSYKNLASQSWIGQGSCCVKDITIAQDGTFIGVGTDMQLYTKPSYKDLTPSWSGPYNSQNSSCCVVNITTVINTNYKSSDFNMTKEPNFNIKQQPLTSIKGSVYWGSSGIALNNSATLQECQASCAKTNGCTGATFNQIDHGKPMCWLRSGDTDVMAGLPNDYAIITKGKQLLMIVKKINQQLTDVNKQIQNKTNKGKPLYERQDQEQAQRDSLLTVQYNNLTKEREKINKMLNEYQTLDQTQYEGNIFLTQNYYSFILLTILSIVLVFVLYKFSGVETAPGETSFIQSGGELGNSAYFIVFSLFLLTLIVFSYKKYSSL